MKEAILDVKTLKAPIVVVRFTVFGDRVMYKLYLKKDFGYYCEDQPSPWFDSSLVDHLNDWQYHSHQEVYL